VTGKPRAAGAVMSSDLGTITRPDGTTQVTLTVAMGFSP
jgi:hypothetical protein